jgi:HK97 family phage prohead protease
MLTLTKDMSGGFKDISQKEGIVTGYLNAFNIKDSDGDITVKGCFAKSILENGPTGKNRIKYLLDHNTQKGVGKFLQLKEDEFGLWYEAKVGDHALGIDYLKMIDGGIVTEHSIGYQVKQWERNETVDTTFLKEIHLYEGSGLQFWAANEYTPITGVKSESDLLQLWDALEKALKNGTYTDETFQNIILPKHNAVSELLQDKFTEPNRKDGITLPRLEEISQAFRDSFKI